MPLWLWIVMSVIAWFTCVWFTVFCAYRFTDSTAKDIENLDAMYWLLWPFVLIWILFVSLSSVSRVSLFSTAMVASEALDDLQKVKKERESAKESLTDKDTYPIPHTPGQPVNDAVFKEYAEIMAQYKDFNNLSAQQRQWAEAMGMRNRQ